MITQHTSSVLQSVVFTLQYQTICKIRKAQYQYLNIVTQTLTGIFSLIQSPSIAGKIENGSYLVIISRIEKCNIAVRGSVLRSVVFTFRTIKAKTVTLWRERTTYKLCASVRSFHQSVVGNRAQ